jgi:CubicO group peptidase (beta-lactamase class C family)
MTELDAILDTLAAEGRIPSLSLCVRVEGEEVFRRTVGLAQIHPAEPANGDQAYDLASVTKALCGAAVAASLVEDGTLHLDGAVADWLDGVDPRITLRHLLQHTSGALWWRPYHAEVTGPWGTEAARQAVLHAVRIEPLVTPPGEAYRYSDTGYLLLLQVLEKAGRAPLDLLFHERVLAPSGVADLRFGWPHAAATEDCPIRGHLVRGTVHDPNCAAMGGVSTHAGLFGTARAVARLGEAFLEATLGNPQFAGLPGPTLRRFWSERGLGSHAVGFDTISPGYSSTGHFFPEDTVGHLGFTGCSLWIAPSRRTVVALLTNRIHPRDERTAIREARPRVHDAVARALGWDYAT